MKARALIRSAHYDPDTLSVIGKAFDGAWDAIEADTDTDAVKDATRLELAKIILALADAGAIGEAAMLRDLALEAMRAGRGSSPLLSAAARRGSP